MSTATASRKGIGGPKTPEGKRRVSLNALKHGLDAKSDQARLSVAQTVGIEYETVLQEMRDYYQPADPVEELLVTRIARCSYRLLITQTMEDNYLNRRCHLSIGKAYEKIIKHERLIDVQLHRAISALARKRAAQEKSEQNKLNIPSAPSSTHAQPNSEFVPQKPSNSAPCQANPTPTNEKPPASPPKHFDLWPLKPLDYHFLSHVYANFALSRPRCRQI